MFFLGIVAVPMGIGITVFASFIVRLLFGAHFAGAAQGLMALVWSTVFLYLAISGGNLLISMGREKISLVLAMLGMGLNIGLNFALIPNIGFIGAAFATTATYFFLLLSSSLAVYKVLFHRERRSAFLNYVAAKVKLSERRSS